MPVQRLRRQLTPDAHPIFLQSGRFPLVRGVAQPEGSDYLCGWCAESVLAANILPRQLWDLAFGCSACNRRSLAPIRPPGWPMGRNVASPFGRTRLVIPAAPIDLPAGAVYASATCAAARQSELSDLAAPLKTIPTRTLEGPQTLQDLVDRTRAVFGLFLSTPTPPETADRRPPRRHSHRLRFLVERVVASIGWFPDAIDIPAIIELDSVVELARAWASDPTWPKRLKTFGEPGEFSHGILECAAASLLIAIGNDVGPQPPRRDRRTADLQCVISAADVLALEVKVPHRLQWPDDAALGWDEAIVLVNHALDSADTGPRGQLDPTRSGILVLGGLHVPLNDAALLRDAAKTCLVAQRHSHIAGVMVVALATHAAGQPVGDLVQVPTGTGMGSAIIHLMALNPHYEGPIVLRARETLDLRDLEGFGDQRQLLPGGEPWEG